MLTMLIESAVRSLAVAAVVWFIITVLRIRNPHIQRTSWLVVVAASLSMPLLMQLGTINIPQDALSVVWDAPQIAAVTTTPNDWQATLIGVYLLICGTLFARLTFGLLQTWRLSRSAQPVTEQWAVGSDVRTTARIVAPVTFASTILLPIDWTHWSAAKREAVLAHESMHVRQHDFYVLILAQVNRAFFWFNPLAWWLSKQLSQLGEIISDDAAIQRIADRPTYATMLLEFSRGARRIPAALSMAQPSTVMARIERILSDNTIPTELGRIAKLCVVIGLAPFIAFAASGSADIRTEPKTTQIAQVQSNPQTQQRAIAPIKAPTESASKRTSAKPASVIVPPKIDPEHPVAPAEEYYPKQSVRNEEEGSTVVGLHVGLDGNVVGTKIQKSSGYYALDEAAIKFVRKWRLKPGTVNSVPQDMWVNYRVTFKLKKEPKTDTGESSSQSIAPTI